MTKRGAQKGSSLFGLGVVAMKSVVYSMKPDNTKAANATHGFEPELDRQLAAQIRLGTQPHIDAEIQSVLNMRSLLVNGEGATQVADVLLAYGTFFSPRLRSLIDELEPNVHHFFEVNVISKEQLGGKTDHGLYYWLRPPPLIDCLLFPETKTAADIQGKTWTKNAVREWGGGVARSKPGFIDREKVEGHHFWRTQTGNAKSTFLFTWSDELYRRYKQAGMRGWEPDLSFEVIDRSTTSAKV
ncbi:MAG: hypothetical protein RIC14_11745 [Filomicrobium sp.]